MFKRIIVGTDGSKAAGNAVACATRLAAITDSELVIAHAFELDPANLPGGYAALPPEELRRLRGIAEKRLREEWSRAAHDARVHWKSIMLDGNAAAALLELADVEKAGLIVVGNRGRGGFAKLLLGGVAYHITQHATVPVMIVPGR